MESELEPMARIVDMATLGAGGVIALLRVVLVVQSRHLGRALFHPCLRGVFAAMDAQDGTREPIDCVFTLITQLP